MKADKRSATGTERSRETAEARRATTALRRRGNRNHPPSRRAVRTRGQKYAISEGAEGTDTYEYTFDDEEEEEPTSEVNRKAVTLRNPYTVIGKSESMPPVEEALEVIPQERVSKTHTEPIELEQKFTTSV